MCNVETRSNLLDPRDKLDGSNYPLTDDARSFVDGKFLPYLYGIIRVESW